VCVCVLHRGPLGKNRLNSVARQQQVSNQDTHLGITPQHD
jgi:hypothetical protein